MKEAIIYRYDGERKTLYLLEPVRDQGYITPDGDQYYAPSTVTNNPLVVELPEGLEISEDACGALALWAGDRRLEIVGDSDETIEAYDGKDFYPLRFIRTADWAELDEK